MLSSCKTILRNGPAPEHGGQCDEDHIDSTHIPQVRDKRIEITGPIRLQVALMIHDCIFCVENFFPGKTDLFSAPLKNHDILCAKNPTCLDLPSPCSWPASVLQKMGSTRVHLQ